MDNKCQTLPKTYCKTCIVDRAKELVKPLNKLTKPFALNNDTRLQIKKIKKQSFFHFLIELIRKSLEKVTDAG